MAPTSTGKMGEHFQIREKSENFSKHTGEVRKIYSFYFYCFGDCLLKRIHLHTNLLKRKLKNAGKLKKILEKVKEILAIFIFIFALI